MELTSPKFFNQYKRRDDFEELLDLVEYHLQNAGNKQLDHVNILIKNLYDIETINGVIKRYIEVGWSNVEVKELTEKLSNPHTLFKFIF